MTLTGRVAERFGDCYRIDCPQAPPHLRTLYLEPYAVRSARIGDRVELTYRVTASQGAWIVTEVKERS